MPPDIDAAGQDGGQDRVGALERLGAVQGGDRPWPGSCPPSTIVCTALRANSSRSSSMSIRASVASSQQREGQDVAHEAAGEAEAAGADEGRSWSLEIYPLHARRLYASNPLRVMPSTIHVGRARKTTRTGRMTNTEAAIVRCVLLSLLVGEPGQDDWQGADILLRQYDQRPQVGVPVEHEGQHTKGRQCRAELRQDDAAVDIELRRPHPRVRRQSIRLGIERANWRKRKIPKASIAEGMIRPHSY